MELGQEQMNTFVEESMMLPEQGGKLDVPFMRPFKEEMPKTATRP